MIRIKRIREVTGCFVNEQCSSSCSLKKGNCKRPTVSYTYQLRVCLPPWADTDSSWKLLINGNADETGWSEGEWFPKKSCSLVPSEDKPDSVGILTMPKWLYNKKLN